MLAPCRDRPPPRPPTVQGFPSSSCQRLALTPSHPYNTVPGREGERGAVIVQVLLAQGLPPGVAMLQPVLPVCAPCGSAARDNFKNPQISPKRFPQPAELAFALVHSSTVLLLADLLWQGGSGFTQDHLWSRSPSWQKPWESAAADTVAGGSLGRPSVRGRG